MRRRRRRRAVRVVGVVGRRGCVRVVRVDARVVRVDSCAEGLGASEHVLHIARRHVRPGYDLPNDSVTRQLAVRSLRGRRCLRVHLLHVMMVLDAAHLRLLRWRIHRRVLSSRAIHTSVLTVTGLLGSSASTTIVWLFLVHIVLLVHTVSVAGQRRLFRHARRGRSVLITRSLVRSLNAIRAVASIGAIYAIEWLICKRHLSAVTATTVARSGVVIHVAIRRRLVEAVVIS